MSVIVAAVRSHVSTTALPRSGRPTARSPATSHEGGEPAGVAAPRSRAELVRIAAKEVVAVTRDVLVEARVVRPQVALSHGRNRKPRRRRQPPRPRSQTSSGAASDRSGGARVAESSGRAPLSRAAGINPPRSVFEPRSSRRRDPVGRPALPTSSSRRPARGGGVSAVARPANAGGRSSRSASPCSSSCSARSPATTSSASTTSNDCSTTATCRTASSRSSCRWRRRRSCCRRGGRRPSGGRPAST